MEVLGFHKDGRPRYEFFHEPLVQLCLQELKWNGKSCLLVRFNGSWPFFNGACVLVPVTVPA